MLSAGSVPTELPCTQSCREEATEWPSCTLNPVLSHWRPEILPVQCTTVGMQARRPLPWSLSTDYQSGGMWGSLDPGHTVGC